MSDERRIHHRLSHPFEGSWRGASGAMRCRIADVSLGGCFVQSLANPSKDESTVVTINIGEHALSFQGEVVYSEPGMGFAVRFTNVVESDLTELMRLMDAQERGESDA